MQKQIQKNRKIKNALKIGAIVVLLALLATVSTACFLFGDDPPPEPAALSLNFPSAVVINTNTTLSFSATGGGGASGSVLSLIGENTANATLSGSVFSAPNEGSATVQVRSTFNNGEILYQQAVINVIFGGTSITNAGDFVAMRSDLGGRFRLEADVDLSSIANFVPIGTSGTPFTGLFDGNGFDITGLTINSMSLYGVGLFGAVSGTGIVRNLTVETSSEGVLGIDAGIVAGFVRAGGRIENVTTRGSIGGDVQDRVGGIAGTIYGGSTITGSTNHARVRGRNHIGGIVGRVGIGNTISANTNRGVVSGVLRIGGIMGFVDSGSGAIHAGNANMGNVSGIRYIGGIVGTIQRMRGSGTHTLAASENSGTIAATGNRAGGIVGNTENEDGTGALRTVAIVDGINNGSVSVASTGDFAGGIAAEVQANIVNSLNTGSVRARSNVGGVVGRVVGTYTITDSINRGSLTAVGMVGIGSVPGTNISFISNTFLGGIAGRTDGPITGSRNEADIRHTATGNTIGGIVGRTSSNLSNNTNEGNITANTSNMVGGIVGQLLSSTARTFTTLTNNGDITARDSVGGIAGTFEVSGQQTPAVTQSTISASINTGTIIGNVAAAGIVGTLIAIPIPRTTTGSQVGSDYSVHNVNLFSLNNSGNVYLRTGAIPTVNNRFGIVGAVNNGAGVGWATSEVTFTQPILNSGTVERFVPDSESSSPYESEETYYYD